MEETRNTLMDTLIGEEKSPSPTLPPPSSTKPPVQYNSEHFYYLPPHIDPFFLSLGKRIYAQINVIVLFVNTIAAVFSISAAVSLIEEDDDFVINTRYDICDYGSPTSINVQCPYLPSPTFVSFLVVWVVYFTTVFTYKFHRTIDYWTHDLRFYLASEATAHDVFMWIMVGIGLILTLISGGGGIYYVIHNGTTSSLGGIFVYMAVNLINLKALAGGKYTILANKPVDEMFPNPIYLTGLPHSKWTNLYGVIYHPQEVIDLFIQMTLQSHQFAPKDKDQEGPAMNLSKYCKDPKEVQAYMRTLLPADYLPNK